MKVGDLVKYRGCPTGLPTPPSPCGLVLEVARNNDRRVKWFGVTRPYWVSQKNLEIVSESVRTKRRDAP